MINMARLNDKKARQQADREAHKAQKQQRKRGEENIAHDEQEVVLQKRILIVCEGKLTEPSYFEQFKAQNVTIKGTGTNTRTVVEEAAFWDNEGEYDEVWCVFDKDSFSAQQFNQAVIDAQTKKFKVGFSNQSFEYWLLLHFEDHQGGKMDRNLYYDKINNYLMAYGLSYNKDHKEITKRIFEELQAIVQTDKEGNKLTRQDLAIRRAKRIHQDHETQGNTPAQADSCTTVYELVEEIKKYL
jgi:hypothetical protein